MKFDSFSDLLPKFLSKKKLASLAISSSIIHEYEQICKEKFKTDKKVSEGKFIRKKVLYVAAIDTAWSQKIFYASREILEKLNQKFPDKIEKIKIKIEPLKK